MTDPAARLAEAEAAHAAWDRFVGPAITLLREDYMRKLAQLGVRPMEGAALAGVQALSHALRVTDEVEKQLQALIIDGDVARKDVQRAADIARMSPEARKWATM